MKKENSVISPERRQFFTKGSKLSTGSLLLSGFFSSLSAKENQIWEVPKWSISLGTATAANLYGQPSPFEKEV